MNEKKEIRFIELFAGVGGFRLGLESIKDGNNFNWQYLQKSKDSRNRGNPSPKRDSSLFSKISKPKTSFRCIWANENDRYACQVYRRRFGDEEQGRGEKPRIKGRGNSQCLNGSTDRFNGFGIWDESSRLLEGDIREIPISNIPNHDLLTGGFPCQSFSIAGRREGFQDLTRGTLFFEICRILRDKRPSYLLLENVKGLLSHDSGRTFAIILLSLDELGYDVEWQVCNTKYFLPQNRGRVFIFGVRR
jgi:site-specific DNA-cytosine methylase